MAAFMYFVLHEQITGLRPSQTGCAAEFRCGATLFKRLITGKRQPGGPDRSGDAGKFSRSLEDVAEMEGATPPSRERPRLNRHVEEAKTEAKAKERRTSRRLSKILKQ